MNVHGKSRLAIGDADFLLDGEPFRILSGSLNYFRVVPEHWRSRLEWARYLGLNTIETYVPWNLHVPTPGVADFTGMLDVAAFLREVAQAGLHAIVRPGPYVCAELDFGGLPAWLLRSDDLTLRSSTPEYLAAAQGWLDQVLPVLAQAQSSRGGPILALQVENEFGSYGHDPDYLSWLVEAFRAHDIDIPLLTCDQNDAQAQRNGGVAGAHRTVNFGSDPSSAWRTVRDLQPDGPLMCMEYWNGWFDHWGEEHHRRDPGDAADVLDEMLAAGASVNLYMFCGGTNFGFTNGANVFDRYQPTITSYDYDAPLTEDGAPTKKLQRYREVLTRHGATPGDRPPAQAARLPRTAVRLTEAEPLLDLLPSLAEPVAGSWPQTMEELGQNFGFVAYEFLTFSMLRIMQILSRLSNSVDCDAWPGPNRVVAARLGRW